MDIKIFYFSKFKALSPYQVRSTETYDSGLHDLYSFIWVTLVSFKSQGIRHHELLSVCLSCITADIWG